MANYYNEIDKYAAEWLRNLIAAGHIAPGVVDERSIEDVHPDDLRGFTQCHFFAGIGVWSYALRRAGWPDDRPIWTGSCPCQPFSSAGAGAGFADERHLWPAFFHLITQCRPATVFGEQVASRDANPWIDLVQDDLEGLGYGVGALPFPSAGIGAPHIRDRLYWVAHAADQRHHRGRSSKPSDGRIAPWKQFERLRDACGLADNNQHGRIALSIDRGHDTQHHAEPCGQSGRLGNTDSQRAGRDAGSLRGSIHKKDRKYSANDVDSSGVTRRLEHAGQHDDASQEATASAKQSQADGSADQPSGSSVSPGTRPGPVNGLWSAADWLLCRDGKWRPVEPGTFPLAHGAPARVGRLRAYGNAINAEAARVFIQAAMSSLETE
ncbi:DNA cytosine methyltransferase [Comamonas sp. 17RB]|uniref:DNA cytosine methyltransferase n=1 Tax=Comamonas sp. 17RB TaxID=3047025 RepID=UPI0024B693CC|nr:DNA cytosine methyltransferase [Comamonas sp. 17RB]MDI9855229.1 DNA cytosine methyltransferase [Comamonas sp. 17RB]